MVPLEKEIYLIQKTQKKEIYLIQKTQKKIQKVIREYLLFPKSLETCFSFT